MRNKFKQYISSLLAISILLTSISITTFADTKPPTTPAPPAIGDDGYIGNEGGNTEGETGHGLDWNTAKQGYRVTIVNSAGEKMCEPVDYLFSTAPEGMQEYWGFKLDGFGEGSKNNQVPITDMMKKAPFDKNDSIPPPILWNGGAVGNGLALKKWMLAGGTGIPSIDFGDSSSGGDSGGGGSSSGTGGGSGGGSPTPPPSEDGWGKQTMDRIITIYAEDFKAIVDDHMMMYPPTPIDIVQRELFNLATQYCNATNSLETATNKNKTYMISGIQSAVNNSYQSYVRQYQNYEKIANKTSITYDYKSQIINSQAIPLADGDPTGGFESSTETGWIFAFLNYKDDTGNYVLDVKKPADYEKINKSGVDNVATRIQAGKYYMFIEAIVWASPTDINYNKYGKQLYGTVTNWGQWSDWANETNGWNDKQIGGKMGAVTNYTGSWCLYLDQPIPPIDGVPGPDVKVPTGVGDPVINSELGRSDMGYALHVYVPGNIMAPASTHTWDSKNYPTGEPAPAPEPPKPIITDDPKDDPKGNPYNITIIKFYENNDLPESNYTRPNNPGTIRVEDEPMYKLVDWHYSPDKKVPTSDTTDYDDTKSDNTITADGTTPTTVNVITPDTTLYLKLVKNDDIPSLTIGDLIIQESQISKSSSTLRAKNSWSTFTPSVTWDFKDISGSCPEPIPYGDDGDTKPCGNPYELNDANVSVSIKHTNEVSEKLLAITDEFKPYTEEVSLTRSGVSSSTQSTSDHDYEFIVWRGEDVPTLSSYKHKEPPAINKLMNQYAIKPFGVREKSLREKQFPLSLILDAKDHGDYTTNSITDHGYTKSSTTDIVTPSQFIGIVTIKMYAGKAHTTGDVTTQGPEHFSLITASQGSTSHVDGYKIQKTVAPIKFYPYIRMTYQITKQYDPSRTDVNIVSEWLSTLIPNSYAEAGWKNPNEELSLALTSEQWSTHARAVSKESDSIQRPWAGKNQVLPGGSIYKLNTDKDKSVVQINTWQTIIPDQKANDSDAMTLRKIIEDQTGAIPNEEYTVSRAVEQHKLFETESRKTLDTLRVVQWVNTNTQADKAWKGGLKILGGDQSLSAINLPNKTGPEDKYYMKADVSGNSPLSNEGDLDILQEKQRASLYKVYSDTQGDVYLASKVIQPSGEKITEAQIDEIEKQITEGKGTKLFDKKVTSDQVASKLSGDALELDNKTKIITNFVKSIERNTGSDTTASWSLTDGKWYNEAWDGILVLRQSTEFTVGFLNPGIRSNALDPGLCPVNTGKSDLFSKAYLSQFRMNSYSDSNGEAKGANYLGTFDSKPITLNDMENLYQSKKFYIPNVVVSDLS